MCLDQLPIKAKVIQLFKSLLNILFKEKLERHSSHKMGFQVVADIHLNQYVGFTLSEDLFKTPITVLCFSMLFTVQCEPSAVYELFENFFDVLNQINLTKC